MERKIKTTGGRILREKSAKGVKGIFISDSMPERYLFRVYHGDGTFDDYKLRFADLSVTIDADSLASFYDDEAGGKFLDERPETLGWKVTETQS